MTIFKLILVSSQLLLSHAQEFGFAGMSGATFFPERATFKVKRIDGYWTDTYADQEYLDIHLKLRTSSVTISGFSSGAILTANLLGMFNGALDGGAIIAGVGPCSPDEVNGFCQAIGTNHSVEGLQDMPIHLFGGTNDALVRTGPTAGDTFSELFNVRATSQWFEDQGADVVYKETDYQHVVANNLPDSLLTPRGSCSENGALGMVNCDDDYAGQYLGRFFPNLVQPATGVDITENGSLYVIDQTRFSNDKSAMNDYGFLYVPTACEGQNDCPLHIFFHGCTQSAAAYGTEVMRGTGLLEYASANNIVMFFPQNYDLSTVETFGLPHCWVSGLQANADHPQLLALRNMVAALYDKDLFVERQTPMKTMGGGLVDTRADYARILVLDKQAVRVTVFCFVILAIKMLKSNLENGWAKGPTGGRPKEDRERFKNQRFTVVRDLDDGQDMSTEEAREFEKAIVKSNRLNRITENDLENLLVGFPTIVMSLLFSRSAVGHIILVILYTYGRTTHTILYKQGAQPWRSISWAIANFSCIAMAIHASIGVFWSS